MKKSVTSRACGRDLRIQIKKGASHCRPAPFVGVHKRRRKLHLALIDADDLVEHVERLLARPLEGVAAYDRAIGATVAQAADLVEQAFEVLGLAAREHD